MRNKFRITTTPLSKNCQTIYFDFKEVLLDEGLDPQITDDCFCLYLCHFKMLCVYFLDLKQMATVYFPRLQLLRVEITGTLII